LLLLLLFAEKNSLFISINFSHPVCWPFRPRTFYTAGENTGDEKPFFVLDPSATTMIEEDPATPPRASSPRGNRRRDDVATIGNGNKAGRR